MDDISIDDVVVEALPETSQSLTAIGKKVAVPGKNKCAALLYMQLYFYINSLRGWYCKSKIVMILINYSDNEW